MRYNSIQVLRCLAVISVLILHSGGAVNQDIYKVPFFHQFGWIGVRLFFVISGFIIAERMDRETRLGPYLVRRYLRVLPLYGLFTIVAIALSAGLGHFMFAFAQTDSGAVYDPEPFVYILKSLFIIPQDDWPIFMVGWSLEYEVIFYVAFGIAFFAGGRTVALVTMLVISGIGIAYPKTFHPILDSMMLYFLFGCLAREVLSRSKRTSMLIPMIIVVLSGVVWMLHLYRVTDLTPIGFIFASGTCFAALIVFCVNLEKSGNYFCRPGLMVLIGNMSFTIYLVHWLVFSTSRHIISNLKFDTTTAESLRIGVIVVSLMASWFVWKFVESPMNRLVQKLTREKR